MSAKIKLQVTNPSSFVTDTNAKDGFDQFMATYIGVTINHIVSVMTELSATKLRRLQSSNVEVDVTVYVPANGSVSKAATKTKFEELDSSENIQLAIALNDAGATGYNPAITDVADITEGTALTAPPPQLETDEDTRGMASGLIATIVILCIVFIGCVVAILVFVFSERQRDENNKNNRDQMDTNADNRGEIPPESMEEHGDGVQVRARQFQINLPQVEDNARVDETKATRS